MKEVVTYRHFMNASGGGVTASGGEAILQAEFVRDWFRACKKEGIHTCRIPTASYVATIRLSTSCWR
nr:Pyruvate formate-lyase 1-activating enzyme [Klebsiella pneumoniae]